MSHTLNSARFPQLPLLLLLLLSIPKLGNATVDSSTSSALSILYTSTNGAQWYTKTNWMTSDPCTASWYGLHCAGSAVKRIDLAGQNLDGTIPSQFGLLSELTAYVYLKSNPLTGTIPSQFGSLTEFFRTLDLSSTSLKSSDSHTQQRQKQTLT